jgi:hypothetical protein
MDAIGANATAFAVPSGGWAEDLRKLVLGRDSRDESGGLKSIVLMAQAATGAPQVSLWWLMRERLSLADSRSIV